MSDEIQQLSGVENVVAAEPQTSTEVQVSEPAAQAERTDAAFAKRLSSEREKMEREYAEKYKDYEVYKGVSEYFRELNEVKEVSELSQMIEQERLKQRAEASQVTPEFQKRIEELELKAAEADSLREQHELQNWYKTFRTDLEKFVVDKEVDPNELEKFMHENKVGSMEIAYKALKFADAQKQKEEIEKAAIARYLDSKKAPKAESSGAAGHVSPHSPKTWEQAKAGALEMMRGANKLV